MVASRRPEVDLLAVAARYAADQAGWPVPLRFDPEQRWYARLAVAADHEVWALSWLPGQGTDLHDHGGSSGARHVHVVTNRDDQPAVSVHVYRPGLTRMTRYRLVGGLLRAAEVAEAGVAW
ncbi:MULTISPECIES: cysteine dioxygenase [unclassified Micromonospora]|uniref:cysteine dioxygenase n=1 Tax=unclassified Micromonospora TaxID=2617518 RepID=UPI003642D34D